MLLTSLGHACWLIEAGELRLLCDPLIEREHYQGVFEVTPPRRLHTERLRPDFIFVSHAHPDHFDVPSLAALAAEDAEAVVVTPDPLVVEAAEALGFATVHQVPAGHRIELDGVTLVTTESVADDEWGLMIAAAPEHGGGVVWNQVDSVFTGPEGVQAIRDRALAALGRARVDLVLAMGRPMHEVAAQLGRAIEFPYPDYARLLAELAAVEARAIVPASADTGHVGAFAWLNRIVYPVGVERFMADAARMCPGAQVLEAGLGARIGVREGAVERWPAGEGDAALVEVLGPAVDRSYRPFAVLELRDPGSALVPGLDLDRARTDVRRWIRDELAPALARAYPSFAVDGPLRLVLELAWPDRTPGAGEGFTIFVDADAATVEPGLDPAWDGYNLAAGTWLCDVIAGRRSWGELLLAGLLRGATRAYGLRDDGGLRPAELAELFVYYALPYADSVRRSVRWQLEKIGPAPTRANE